MADDSILREIDEGGTAWLTLNRPRVHNAFDDGMIADLTDILRQTETDPAVRAVIITGAGKSFSAGADLAWMRRMAEYSEEENIRDINALETLFNVLYRLGKPTIALVNGAAMGGGAGLVAACDIAVAADDAVFAFTEVRLGLIPSVISPYVIAAMGSRPARRYFLTGEKFSAADALRLGLVGAVVPRNGLRDTAAALLKHLAANGPQAMKEAKELIAAVAGRPIDDALIADTARRIARVRASKEGKEGIAAFFDKRRPRWSRD